MGGAVAAFTISFVFFFLFTPENSIEMSGFILYSALFHVFSM